MPFSWESLYSFLSPPALRDASYLPSAFSFSQSTDDKTKRTDLPMPPTTAHGAAAAESPASSLAPSERDYLPPTSPYSHRSPSMSSTSTASTAPSEHPHSHDDDDDGYGSRRAQRTAAAAPPVSGGDEAADRPAAPRRSATDVVALDPLSRSFPKPAHEPSLDELLARAPCRHSLGHYVRNAARAAREPAAAAEGEAEERARKFEEAKRELLRAKEEMERLAAGRR